MLTLNKHIMKRQVLFILFSLLLNIGCIAQTTQIKRCTEQQIPYSARNKYIKQAKQYLQSFYSQLLMNVGDLMVQEQFIENHMETGQARYKPEFLLTSTSNSHFLTPRQYMQELNKLFKNINIDDISIEASNILIDEREFFLPNIVSCYVIATYNLTIKNNEQVIAKRRCRAYCLFPNVMAYITVKLLQVEPIEEIEFMGHTTADVETNENTIAISDIKKQTNSEHAKPSIDCKLTHQVKKGETVSKIAQKYDITIGQLLRANPDIIDFKITINKKLCIPHSHNRTKNKNTIAYKHNDYHYVNLGLSVLWATCNVGAKTSDETGTYFAFGEIKTKKSFFVENSLTYQKKMEDISGKHLYDAARHVMTGFWRTPTKSEIEELVNECYWEYDSGKQGYKITGPNGNSIFLPINGFINENNKQGLNDLMMGRYMSSTPVTDDKCVWVLDFSKDYIKLSSNNRSFGFNIRPVFEF